MLEDDLDYGIGQHRKEIAAIMDNTHELENEVYTATRLHPPFPTVHHGYGVLKEEVDELWKEIKKKKPSKEKMRKEALQVAAVAVRFVHDLCNEESQ